MPSWKRSSSLAPAIVLVLALAGCGHDEGLMPLKVGASWSYMSRAGLQALPDTITVTRQVAVDGVEGYELAGNQGVSHLAWSHGRLITDQMTGARFLPPLPLMVPAQAHASWQGWIIEGDRREPAKADVTHEVQKLDLVGKDETTTRSTVELKVGKRRVELSTWFQRGVGIVRQEQRTDGRLDLELEYLGG